MKKRTILALVAIAIALISVFRLKQQFPELTWPVIDNYSSDPETVTDKGSPYKIYYDQLAPIEKQAYNMIMDKIYNMPDKILVPDLNENELDNVFEAILSDNPDLFFLGRRCSVRAVLWNNFFQAEYIISKEEYPQQKAELERKTKEIIATLPRDSEYNTELAIHDYIVKHTDYKIEERQYVYSSSYGCLVNGIAACEGYSKAAKLLMDEVGIKSYLISGTAVTSQEEGGNHMWNIVEIDGKYYHLDCTWDDPITDKNTRTIQHTYFNVSDSVIKKSHSNFSLNLDCSSSGANYYEKNGLIFSDYSSSDEDKLADTLYKQYYAGVKEIQIGFGSKDSFDEAKKQLIDEGRIYKVLNKKGSHFARKITGYYENADAYTLTFIFK